MRWIVHTWGMIWPNLVASLLWVPATFVHITRSNKKSLKLYLGKAPGDDNQGVGSDDSRD